MSQRHGGFGAFSFRLSDLLGTGTIASPNLSCDGIYTVLGRWVRRQEFRRAAAFLSFEQDAEEIHQAVGVVTGSVGNLQPNFIGLVFVLSAEGRGRQELKDERRRARGQPVIEK